VTDPSPVSPEIEARLQATIAAIRKLEQLGVSGCDVDCLAPDEESAVRELFMAIRQTEDYLGPYPTPIADALAAVRLAQEAQPEEQLPAWLTRWMSGERYGVSTGICESETYGYGELDHNGYWEIPMPASFVKRLRTIRDDRLQVADAECDALRAALVEQQQQTDSYRNMALLRERESTALRARVEALEAERGWQPIETAPRGGGAARTDDPAWVEPPRILGWSSSRGLMIVYWDWYYAERGNGYKPGQTAWVSESEALWEADAPILWKPEPLPPAPSASMPERTEP
jgi:hypothetical protein